MTNFIKTNPSNTTYAFIDSQNLHQGIKGQRWKLDYEKFRKFLRQEYQVVRAFIYIGYIEEYEDLYASLRDWGYEPVFTEITKFSRGEDEHIKGNVDVDMTVDSIRRAREYSRALFVSADGDFLSAYDYLTRELKKELLIFAPNSKRYSHLLDEHYPDQLKFLDSHKQELRLTHK